MSTFIIQRSLLGLVRLLTTAVAAGWVGSPMSWSPDGRWLCYTTAPDPSSVERRAGWLFEATPGEPGPFGRLDHADARGDAAPPAWSGAAGYRLWASPRDGGPSALIEGSDWPLTAPSWNPRGHSLAFGRFVPDSIGPQGPSTRGSLEVAVQDGLDRKRTLVALPGFELDDQARAQFPQAGPDWSPDGQFLAVPRPGRVPAVLIVRVESRRVVQTIERALLPSWSPDGSRLAYLHQDEEGAYSLHLVERRGPAFAAPRAVLEVGRIAAPLGWGAEGRSILAVVERTRMRPSDVDLVRVAPDSHDSARIFTLVQEPLRRMAAVRGIAIAYDRSEELCFFSTDLDGRETDICWSIPRDQQPYKRFHPLDPTLRVGGLAIAPDGHAVAMRFATPGGGLSPPAVCELETDHIPPTERTTLIVPDEATRRAWLGLLTRTARSLLDIAMTPIVADGRPIRRPTALPLPDDIPPAPPIRSRFTRLGRYGSSLCTTRRRSEAAPTGAEPQAESELDLEDRLFFDYLEGEYAAATADLEALEARTEGRGRRLALLSLRAQILWAQGDTERAGQVAAYLVDAVGGPVYRVEETPMGRSLVEEPGPERAWARYLSARASQPYNPAAAASEPDAGDREDLVPMNPFAPMGPPGLDLQPGRLPGDVMPMLPNPRDPQAEAMIRALLRQRQLQLELQRRQAQPPPPPRPIGRPPR